jgi:hypothetical protein
VKDNSVLLAEISEKESIFYLSVKYLSYVVGCLGAIGFFLRLFERCGKSTYEYIQKKRNKIDHRSNAGILKGQVNIEREPEEINIDEISPMGIEISLSPIKYKRTPSDTMTRYLMHRSAISTTSSHQLESFSNTRKSSKISRHNQILPEYN